MLKPLPALLVLCGLLLVACLSQGRDARSSQELLLRSGRIELLKVTQLHDSHASGVQAIVGGPGIALGNLLGRGNSDDVARVSAALAGPRRARYSTPSAYRPAKPAQQIIVRLSNGVLVAITQPTEGHLRPAMPVYIDGAGLQARVVAQP